VPNIRAASPNEGHRNVVDAASVNSDAGSIGHDNLPNLPQCIEATFLRNSSKVRVGRNKRRDGFTILGKRHRRAVPASGGFDWFVFRRNAATAAITAFARE